MSAEIRALMGRHRVSQTELARWLGMSQSALSERLNGRVAWDVDDLNGVAERFGVEVAALFAPPPAHNPRYGNIIPVTTDSELVDTNVRFDGVSEARFPELVKA